MGQVLDFEAHAVASLRRRVAEVEEANQDLIAFARGHSGAVSAIHAAVLAAIEAESLDHLFQVVTERWPEVLGLDAVALALFAGGRGLRVDLSGVQVVEPRLIERAMAGVDSVVLRGVEQGHPLFGPAASLIRAEALIRLSDTPPFPSGLLVLGQRGGQRFETKHGSELLVFLGRTLSRTIGRWLAS